MLVVATDEEQVSRIYCSPQYTLWGRSHPISRLAKIVSDYRVKQVEGSTTRVHCALEIDRRLDSIISALHQQVSSDINRYDDHGLSVLHYAVGNQDADEVKVMLEAGADPNMKTADGQGYKPLILDSRPITPH